jgi:ankyrin repeat protein
MKSEILGIMTIMFLSIFLVAAVAINSFAQDHEIFAAVWTGNTIKVRKLLAVRPDLVHLKNKEGATPLHYAARIGQYEIAKLLISKRADVNARDRATATPLYWASLYGHTGIVRLLLAVKADVNSRGTTETPLCSASSQGHLEIVRVLLAAKADVNLQDVNGITALHKALYPDSGEHKYVNIVRLLLHAGADTNVYDNSGETPLITAARQDCPAEVVRMLLAAGANVAARDKQGRDALAYTNYDKTPEIAQILRAALDKRRGVNIQSPPSTQSNSSSQDQPKYYNVIYICRWARSDSISEIKSAEMTTFAQGKDEIDAGYNGIGQFEVRERCKAMAKSNGGYNGEPRFKRASLVR